MELHNLFFLFFFCIIILSFNTESCIHAGSASFTQTLCSYLWERTSSVIDAITITCHCRTKYTHSAKQRGVLRFREGRQTMGCTFDNGLHLCLWVTGRWRGKEKKGGQTHGRKDNAVAKKQQKCEWGKESNHFHKWLCRWVVIHHECVPVVLWFPRLALRQNCVLIDHQNCDLRPPPVWSKWHCCISSFIDCSVAYSQNHCPITNDVFPPLRLLLITTQLLNRGEIQRRTLNWFTWLFLLILFFNVRSKHGSQKRTTRRPEHHFCMMSWIICT